MPKTGLQLWFPCSQPSNRQYFPGFLVIYWKLFFNNLVDSDNDMEPSMWVKLQRASSTDLWNPASFMRYLLRTMRGGNRIFMINHNVWNSRTMVIFYSVDLDDCELLKIIIAAEYEQHFSFFGLFRLSQFIHNQAYFTWFCVFLVPE